MIGPPQNIPTTTLPLDTSMDVAIQDVARAGKFEAGTLLVRDFGADVLLLDDGFQHQRLARNVDVVLIDALDPFGGGQVFPLGRLREPPAGLARAHLIL